jgi:S1-C subfamily serine protease
MSKTDGIVIRVVLRTGLLFLVICGLAGCSSRPITTTARRDAAFAPFRDISIDGTPIEIFLVNRSAVVITGSEKSEPERPNTSLEERISFTPSSKFQIGSAAMIDSRGYLLTAAHVVDEKPIMVVFRDGITVRRYPARLVWNGFEAPYATDLALLHVDVPLPATFQWAKQYQAGESALAAGVNYSDKPYVPNYIMGFTAGKLVPNQPPVRDKITQLVISDLPLHSGDSGGPLVNAEGRLIGINVRGKMSSLEHLGITRSIISTSLRPDITWLEQLIEEDFVRTFAKRSATTQ